MRNAEFGMRNAQAAPSERECAGWHALSKDAKGVASH